MLTRYTFDSLLVNIGRSVGAVWVCARAAPRSRILSSPTRTQWARAVDWGPHRFVDAPGLPIDRLPELRTV